MIDDMRDPTITKFRIEYRDPETGENTTVDREFTGTASVSAREWAEDYAYSLADKGPYQITEIR